MYEIMHTNLINKITYSIYNFIEYFARDDKTKTISVSIPSDILYRSQLICEYIKGEIDEDFDLDNLLMILYMNFIKECVKITIPNQYMPYWIKHIMIQKIL